MFTCHGRLAVFVPQKTHVAFLLHSMHGEKPAKIQYEKPGAELLVHQNHAHGLLDVLNVLAKQRRFSNKSAI